MLACTALVGCTSDDVLENGSVDNGGNKKFAINIGLNYVSDGQNSRGAHQGTFNDGTEAEYNVNNTWFIFYDNSKVCLGVTNNVTWKDPDATKTDNITREGTVQFTSYTKPVYAAVLVNGTEAIAKQYAATGKAFDLLNEPKTHALADVTGATNGFFMTNSTHLHDTEIIDIVKLDPKSIEEVEDNGSVTYPSAATNIYVERVTAKVTLDFSEDLKKKEKADDNTKYYVLDSKNQQTPKLAVTINGWALNGTNNSYYPIKQIANNWSTGWYDNQNHRSYWAIDNNYSNGSYLEASGLTNLALEDGATDTGNKYDLKYITLASKNFGPIGTSNPQYCYENTMNKSSLGNLSSVTHVVIKAQYMHYDETTQTATVLADDENVYRIGQAVWTEDALKNDVVGYLQNNNYIVQSTTEGAAAITWTEEEIAAVKDAVTFTIGMSEENTPIVTEIMLKGYTMIAQGTEAATTNLKDKFDQIDAYKGGYCSYTIPIKHFAKDDTNDVTTKHVDAGEEGYWGVVRNHWYQLVVTDIAAFGEPESAKPIIPEDNKLMTFAINCNINVVAYSVVSQQTSVGSGTEWD